MDLNTTSASRRQSLTATAGPLAAFPQYSSGLDQDTPRLPGDRPSPIAIHTGVVSSSSSPQKSYANESLYYTQQHQQDSWSSSTPSHTYATSCTSQDPRSASSAPAPYSPYQTGDISPIQTDSPVTPPAYSPPFSHPTVVSIVEQQTLAQLDVSMSSHASLHSHTSVMHDPLAITHAASPQSQNSMDQGRQVLRSQQLQHWNTTAAATAAVTATATATASPIYPPDSSSYHRSPSSAHGGQFMQRDTSGFPGEGENGTGHVASGFDHSSSRTPQQHQQRYPHEQRYPEQQQTPQQDTLQAQLLSPSTSAGSGFLRQGGGSSSADSTVSFRDHMTVHASAAPVYLPRLSPASTMASHSHYQTYQHPEYHSQQQQQQTHHMGTSADDAVRYIPPLLSSQVTLPGISASSIGYPGTSGTPVTPGVHRTSFSYPGHYPSGCAMSGQILSSTGSQGGQPAILGGNGFSFGSPDGRRPLLYSNTSRLVHSNHMGSSGVFGHQGRGSPGRGGLSTHDRPYRCDQCLQSFNRNHDLKRHKRIHLAVKPFPCTFCEKSFSRKDALKRHRLVKGCGEKLLNTDLVSLNSEAGSR